MYSMKVLIVDEMHESIVQMPQELGLKVDYFPQASMSEIRQMVQEYDGLIIRSKFEIDAAFLTLAPKLRFIGRAGAGLDLIDLEACAQRQIAVFSANEANRVAVAEHLIGMLLALFNRIPQANAEVKQGIWRREANRGEELFGKTVGIIGFGHNGQATAERLVAFGCEVLAYDKYRYGFGNQFIKECTMAEIYQKADIVSLHIPLSAETNRHLGSSFFQSFVKPIYFCNIARGELVDLSALRESMIQKKVVGACLDVLENEKLNQLTPEQKKNLDFLSQSPHVILTPHVAGWTFESYKKINDVLRDKIKRYLDSLPTTE